MRLYFLRHGRADRSAWSGPDDQRPLTPEGRERMQREARRMRKLDLDLDVILTSPLTRAFETALIVAEELSLEDHLVEDARLGLGFHPRHVGAFLNDYPDADSMMFVGHEPSFSETISELIGGGNIVCKKGSLARVDLADAGYLSGELVWLLQPKTLLA